MARERKRHSDRIDILFSKHVAKEFHIEIAGDASVPRIMEEKAGDIRDLLHLYRAFLVEHYEEEQAPDTPIYPLGLEMLPGITLISGKPDYGKTSIGCEAANEMFKAGKTVVYVDAENKVSSRQLQKGIIYLPGRAHTYTAIKKLVSSGAPDFMVIDTIFALSRNEDCLRSIVKHVRPGGVYVLLLNQTRYWRFGQYSAGPDVIEEFARVKLQIVRRRKLGSHIYLKTNTDKWFVFDVADNSEILRFNKGETDLADHLSTGKVIKIGRKYKYRNRKYVKQSLVKLLGK